MYFIFRPDDDRFFAVYDDAAHPNDGEEGEKKSLNERDGSFVNNHTKLMERQHWIVAY